MASSYRRVLIVLAGCLLVAGILGTRFGAPRNVSAQEQKAGDLVWIGVQVYVPNHEENDYLIGTVDKATIDAIESDKYQKRFLKLSNLRAEESMDEAGEKVAHFACADAYDQGVILVQYKDVLSIEFKTGDPLEVARPK